MHHVDPLPDDEDLAPIVDLVQTPPDEVWGKKIEWKAIRPPELVFLRRFSTPEPRHGRRVYLFASAHDLLGSLVDGELHGRGHFIEYIVARKISPNEWSVHRLLQRGGSVAFSAVREKNDDPQLASVPKDARRALHAYPKWKPSQAQWPTLKGKPMLFVGQVTLPDYESKPPHLCCDETVYLFWEYSVGAEHFKVMVQDSSGQTLEEHYAEEDARWQAGEN